eukprot:TRINITY_DN2658_c0_g1_i2.p1 TRINITY_DN2658_c0_g1~~TRINITY_DN2658_c0_g1_i2.p1  ORF type:complete len:232 (-),score=42.51 TRINITY_DN2658_c0_g1_i2:101-796(-)
MFPRIATRHTPRTFSSSARMVSASTPPSSDDPNNTNVETESIFNKLLGADKVSSADKGTDNINSTGDASSTTTDQQPANSRMAAKEALLKKIESMPELPPITGAPLTEPLEGFEQDTKYLGKPSSPFASSSQSQSQSQSSNPSTQQQHQSHIPDSAVITSTLPSNNLRVKFNPSRAFSLSLFFSLRLIPVLHFLAPVPSCRSSHKTHMVPPPRLVSRSVLVVATRQRRTRE